jgi:hypothetical protein
VDRKAPFRRITYGIGIYRHLSIAEDNIQQVAALSRRLLVAAMFGLIAFPIWLLVIRRCMPFWLLPKDGHWQFPTLLAVVIVAFPPIWIFTLVCLKPLGRALLIVCTAILAGVLLIVPDLRLVPIPAVESTVVSVLVKMHSDLASRPARTDSTATLSDTETPLPIKRFYDVQYHHADKSIGAVLTPAARSCGCVRNFTIDENGKVHYTYDSRAANADDPVVPLE